MRDFITSSGFLSHGLNIAEATSRPPSKVRSIDMTSYCDSSLRSHGESLLSTFIHNTHHGRPRCHALPLFCFKPRDLLSLSLYDSISLSLSLPPPHSLSISLSLSLPLTLFLYLFPCLYLLLYVCPYSFSLSTSLFLSFSLLVCLSLPHSLPFSLFLSISICRPLFLSLSLPPSLSRCLSPSQAPRKLLIDLLPVYHAIAKPSGRFYEREPSPSNLASHNLLMYMCIIQNVCATSSHFIISISLMLPLLRPRWRRKTCVGKVQKKDFRDTLICIIYLQLSRLSFVSNYFLFIYFFFERKGNQISFVLNNGNKISVVFLLSLWYFLCHSYFFHHYYKKQERKRIFRKYRV